MNCRLCNEKIPRMRALFKKSEFCCDEHADQYKDQTLNRLLVEAQQPAVSAAPRPLPQASDLPLASLESRTPLSDGQTVQDGPRRLAPPKLESSAAERPSGFGGLLDRLRQKKALSPAAGNIGGWNEAGGEDPLEALMRLEGAVPASPAGLGRARAARPAGFDLASGVASSSEEDAISALRRLAEEARQSARSKPANTAGLGADAEDPFARLTTGDWGTSKAPAADDPGASPAMLLPAAGEPEDGQSFGDRPFDYREEENAGSETVAGDDASLFDRLVRDFDSDTSDAPDDELVLPAPTRSESYTDAWREPASATLPGNDDAPFAGSAFDRLMADAPPPKSAKAVESPRLASERQGWADSSRHTQREEAVEPPIAAGTETVIPTAMQGKADEVPAAATPPAEMEAVTGAAGSAALAEPASPVRSNRCKAAPIAARTELSDSALAGWPAGAAATIELERIEQEFAGQRAAEAAQYAPQSPPLLQPSSLNLPVRNGKPAARSGDFRNARIIPWRALIPQTESPPADSVALEHSGAPALETGRSEPLPPVPLPHIPGPARVNRHSQGRFRSSGIEGRVVAIDPLPARALPPYDVSRPPLECLPGQGRRAGPLPLTMRGARGSLCTARLELAEALPFAGPSADAVSRSHNAFALPPKGPVRLPGLEQNGSIASSGAAVLPGAVVLPGALGELVGAEPRGSSLETADPQQVRRLIAEQTATGARANGSDGAAWKLSIAPEPFHPALKLENGHRP